MRTKTRDAGGRQTEQDIFDVDLDRLPCVIPVSAAERVANRDTGEAIDAENGTPLYQAQVLVPGCRLAGGSTGMNEVRLRIEAHAEPRFALYQALRMHGPARLSGRTVGERADRRGYLSIRCRGVETFETPVDMTALSDQVIPGVPISYGDDAGLVVLAASEPRNVYDGRAVEIMGQRQMRLQLSKVAAFTRDDGTEFTRHEALTVDVPMTAWEQRPIPFLARVKIHDLRCDARVNENTNRHLMVLAAAGYSIVEPSSPFAQPAPAPHQRDRRSRPEAAPEAAPEGTEG